MNNEKNSKLIKLIQRAPKCTFTEVKSNVFCSFDPKFSKVFDGEVGELVRISGQITYRAREVLNSRKEQIAPVKIFTNGELAYVSGGIYFEDEQTTGLLGKYFDLGISGTAISHKPGESGFDVLIGVRESDNGMSFATRGHEWETRKGYAHLVLGYIPYKE